MQAHPKISCILLSALFNSEAQIYSPEDISSTKHQRFHLFVTTTESAIRRLFFSTREGYSLEIPSPENRPRFSFACPQIILTRENLTHRG